MKIKLVNKIRISLMSAFLVILILFLISAFFLDKITAESNKLVHTNQVQRNIESIISFTKDGESAVRGYAAIKDPSFLIPFKQSRISADSQYHVLRVLVKDNPEQLHNLDTLYGLIKEKYALLSAASVKIKGDSSYASDEMKRLGSRGINTMIAIKAKAKDMINIESGLMENRKESFEDTTSTIQFINYCACVIVVMVAAFTFISYSKENKDKEIANEKAALYRQELENRIEELNKANRELIDLKSIEKFAATGRIARTIAHEIRNPLTNIGLASEQIKEETGENEDLQMLFDMINRNVTRINQLITDLLSSTKFAQLEFTRISVNDLVDESIELVEDRLKLKDVKLVREYKADDCDVTVDKDKMKIAFVNILVNAIEALPEKGGLIVVKTSTRNHKCTITVKDNGSGIEKETLGNIFEPYYTSKKKGNGLGLTNTQNIILNHKGKIYAESEISKGTSMMVELNTI